MNRIFSGLFCLMMLGIASCQLGELTPEGGAGSRYFPITIGQYVDYEVYQITYEEFIANDTSIFQMREVLADTFQDAANQQAFRLERFVRDNSSQAWQLDSIWTLRQDMGRIIRTENNIPIIKIVFPERNGLEWDGNALNALAADIFRMDSLNRPFQENGLDFASTLRITQNRDSSLVGRDVRWEVYADSIGMVYGFTQSFLYVDDSNSPLFGTNTIIGGVFREVRYLNHGKL